MLSQLYQFADGLHIRLSDLKVHLNHLEILLKLQILTQKV